MTAGWHSIQAVYGSDDWLGYKSDNQKVTMRVMDFYHHHEGKIRENWVPIDLIFQTGINPIHTSRGSEGFWLNPINCDGVNFFEKDMKVSEESLDQSLTMQRSLNIKPELGSK